MEYCKVCRGDWSRRHLRWKMREFDELNPRRARGTSQRMNDSQYHYLLRHFFDSYGKHKNICRQHLREFASISQGKVGQLISMSQHPIDWERPWLDGPPPRPNFPPHRVLPQEVDRMLLDFFEENSTPLTDKCGYVLDAKFRSKREVYRNFKETKLENTELRVSRPTFLAHWTQLRSDIVIHTHRNCACSVCTAFHSQEEKYKSNTSVPV